MGRKIIVGVTGASGAIYARSLLEILGELSDQLEEVALIFSDNGRAVWEFELGHIPPFSAPFRVYDNNNLFAPVASGSAGFDTMFIAPCTMGTLGRIAAGTSSDLICRSADVMLKERRRLIVVPRELPLSLIHIENMRTVTLAGGIIVPASPSFYSRPSSMEELVRTVVFRMIDLAGLELPHYRWGEAKSDS